MKNLLLTLSLSLALPGLALAQLPPPRATVQARLAQPGWRVEIVATAAL